MLKKAILSKLSQRKSNESIPVEFDKAKTVGILDIFESEIQKEILLKALKKTEKNTFLISFIINPDKNRHYPSHTFSAKHISLIGNINNDKLSDFVKKKYDYLISLDNSGNEFIKYILSKTTSKYRVGFYHSNFEGLLDMMIKPRSQKTAVQEMLKYLKMIKQ